MCYILGVEVSSTLAIRLKSVDPTRGYKNGIGGKSVNSDMSRLSKHELLFSPKMNGRAMLWVGSNPQDLRRIILVSAQQTLPTAVMDAYAEEGSSLLRSRRMVGDALQTGQASLASLVDQRSRLKVQYKQTNVVGIQSRVQQSAVLHCSHVSSTW